MPMNKRMSALLCAGLLGLTATAAHAKVLYETDFSQLHEWVKRGNKNQQVVPSPDGKGGTAVLYQLNYNDSPNFRSETIHISGRVPDEVRNAHLGKEYWYGFKIWLEDYKYDDDGEIVFQWHGVPDTDSSGNKIEQYRNPPLSLSVDRGKWSIKSVSDKRKLTPDGRPIQYTTFRKFDINKAETGRWVHWVFRVRWDSGHQGNGLLQVWQNGKRVVNQSGPNTFNDDQGPYMATGIYKYQWKNGRTLVSNRSRYNGALRVADGDGSFDAVSTMGDGSAPTLPGVPRKLRVEISEAR